MCILCVYFVYTVPIVHIGCIQMYVLLALSLRGPATIGQSALNCVLTILMTMFCSQSVTLDFIQALLIHWKDDHCHENSI